MKYAIILTAILIGCCPTKETIRNVFESDSVSTETKIIPVFLPRYILQLYPVVIKGVPMTYAPVNETFISKDSTARVDIDRKDPDKPTAQFTFNGDSVDALGKEITYWKKRYESKETKIGDSFTENLKDYAIGAVLIILFGGLLIIVTKVKLI